MGATCYPSSNIENKQADKQTKKETKADILGGPRSQNQDQQVKVTGNSFFLQEKLQGLELPCRGRTRVKEEGARQTGGDTTEHVPASMVSKVLSDGRSSEKAGGRLWEGNSKTSVMNSG